MSDRNGEDSDRSAIWIALLLVVAFILYGSLYPFHFHPQRNPLFQWDWPGGLSAIRDAVINIAIYFPAGFFAFYLWPKPLGSPMRILLSTLSLLVFSSAVEYLQAYDFPRFSSSADILNNTLGSLAGAVTASLLRLKIPALTPIRKRPAPFLLLSLAVAAHLFPFFPRTHLVHLRAVLPAFFSAPAVVPVVLSAVEWFGVRLLLAELLGRKTVTGEFACLLLIVPAGLFVVDQSPASAEMLGALLALAAGHYWELPSGRFAWLLLVDVVLRELSPFRFSGPARPFEWMPFGSSLGMPSFSLPVLIGKFFLYGTVIWLFGCKGIRMLRVAVPFAVLLFVLEQVQRYLPGRTPEITDGVIAFLAGLGLFVVQKGGKDQRHMRS